MDDDLAQSRQHTGQHEGLIDLEKVAWYFKRTTKLETLRWCSSSSWSLTCIIKLVGSMAQGLLKIAEVWYEMSEGSQDKVCWGTHW